jgi:hypothetical protein
MKKLFVLMLTLAMLVSALPVNAAKETAQIENTIHATYAIYLNTQFKASVPGGPSDSLGMEVYDECTGEKVVYWDKPLDKELVKRVGGWEDYEKSITAGVLDSRFWGTVLYIEFDNDGFVSKVRIHERFRSWEGTDYSFDNVK